MENLFKEYIREKRYLQNVTNKTISTYEQAWKRFTGLNLELTKSGIKEFVIKLREAGLSPGGINTYCRSMNSFLTWLHTNEHLPEPLKIKLLKEEKRVLKTFTEAQLKAIINFKPRTPAEKRLHCLLLLLTDTGVRIAECLSLKRGSVNFDDCLITVMGKGNKQRIIPISVELRKSLFLYLKGHKFDLVFPTKHGTKQLYDNVRRDFYLLMDKLGIEGFDGAMHAFRRAFAKNYIRSGGNVVYLQHSLGHSTLEMTRKYVEVEIEALQESHIKTSLLGRLHS
jgi:integrase/recombinase XerD